MKKQKPNYDWKEDYEFAMEILSPYRPLEGNLADAATSATSQIGWTRSLVYSMLKNARAAHEGNDMLVIRPFVRTTNIFDDLTISCPHPSHQAEKIAQHCTQFSDPFVFDLEKRFSIVIPAKSQCGHRWLLVLETRDGLTRPYTICDEGYINQNTVETYDEQ
tara:strand:- start:1379 stop:1864 length:486 start_codon:yes stop_codon:yes gene_type:complete